jgi:hypothetical protein
MQIILKLNPKTARHLSYCIGRSDEANAVVGAATQAARSAERNVHDMIAMIADQDGQKIPDNFAVTFDSELNQIIITEQETTQYVAPIPLQVNGVKEH